MDHSVESTQYVYNLYITHSSSKLLYNILEQSNFQTFEFLICIDQNKQRDM